jgi:hypothetical protein
MASVKKKALYVVIIQQCVEQKEFFSLLKKKSYSVVKTFANLFGDAVIIKIAEDVIPVRISNLTN